MKNSSEPSDAMRFLDESKQLYEVFFKSKSDFFSLFTGIGDNARMIHEHMNKTFIWDAGNFTLINDSRNTIRVNCLFQFISFGSDFVHTLIMCALSLIGIQQLFLAIKSYSSIKSYFLFFSLLLFPSLLFWSSSILKEPLLILGIGLFARSCLVNDSILKRVILGGIGILLLILFKPYIILCLIPGILFYLTYNHVFKQQGWKVLITFLSLLSLIFFFSPKLRTKITNNLSTKQMHLENVGDGGMHVYGKTGYYYFKPYQYKNLKIIKNKVELIHESDAYLLSYDNGETLKKIHLKPTKEKWLIHIIMPGTNSYFKTKSIDYSFTRLILNIPEALINSIFRPFPLDKGSFLMYPAMLEVWVLFIFLLVSLYFRKKITKKDIGIIYCLSIFAFLLLLLIGWTTPITGAIVRFRFPAQLALFIIGAIIIDPSKMNFKKK